MNAKRRKYSREDIKKMSQEPVAGWRLWLFRTVSVVVIPLLVLLLAEIVLRVVGYGFPTTVAVKCEVNGTACCCSNPKFAWQFFHPNAARTSESFVFSANKPKDTYRIFVIGSSAAAGIPERAYCFGRILQLMLRQQYPQTKFEVITVAMPAINSHAILEITKDCVHYKPDLFIAYMGNNEVVGPYGAGTVLTPLGTSISLVRLSIRLKAMRLGQLMTNLLESAGADTAPKTWSGMEMFAGKQVRADETSLKTVYRNFQRNLQDIYRLAIKNKTKIIFCTVACNLKDNPPFASLHRQDLTEADKENWDTLYQAAVKDETEGHYAQAVEQYLVAEKIDNNYADLQFRLGRCYWAMGEYDKARAMYIQALELDTLRFRADTQINKAIRDLADNKTAEGVYLVDAVRVFEENSPHEVPGEELFYEHAHMNFSGNYLLAKAIFKQAEEILPEWIKHYKADGLLPLTETECARYLAHTEWNRYKIADNVLNRFIKHAPFTNQLYHNQQVIQMEQANNSLKASLSPATFEQIEAQYRWAIQQTPSDWVLYLKYGELLEELKKYASAIKQYEMALNYNPNRYETCQQLGMLYGNQKNPDACIKYNLEALRIYPHASSYYNIGLSYQTLGRLDKAVKYYYKTIRLDPQYPPAYYRLGAILHQQGKIDKAVKLYRRGVLAMPNEAVMHYNLGFLLERQGHKQESAEEFHAALKLDPNLVQMRKKTGGI
jgi:tetratricopeptide (TPR) repeat protein